MSDETPQPRFEISGAPTPEEVAAASAAILALWRQERAEAVAEEGRSRWVLSGRAAATGNGPADFGRGPDAWRLSHRVSGHGMISVRRTGRGDSR